MTEAPAAASGVSSPSAEPTRRAGGRWIALIALANLVTDVVSGNAGYVLLAACVVACALPFAITTPGLRLRRADRPAWRDRKSTRLNSSHVEISYAVFCLKKKNNSTNSRRLYNKKKENTQ